jgi:hypothetical protein
LIMATFGVYVCGFLQVSLGLVYGRITRILMPLARCSRVSSTLTHEQVDRLV